MSHKTIEMSVRQGNSVITLRNVLDEHAPWFAQAYMFHKFLLAQGYVLDGEDVGSDVHSFVNAEVDEE